MKIKEINLLTRLVEITAADVVSNSNLSPEEISYLLRNKVETSDAVYEAVLKTLETERKRYNQSKETVSFYPPAYTGLMPLEKTINLINLLIKMPELPSLPPKAEGWCILNLDPEYGETALDELSRKIHILIGENVFKRDEPRILSLNERTKSAYAYLRAKWKNGIAIFPVQFGNKTRTGSKCHPEDIELEENEFFLDWNAITSLLVLHPERLPIKGTPSICCYGNAAQKIDEVKCYPKYLFRDFGVVLDLKEARPNEAIPTGFIV